MAPNTVDCNVLWHNNQLCKLSIMIPYSYTIEILKIYCLHLQTWNTARRHIINMPTNCVQNIVCMLEITKY